jgi:hypothetical protein
VLGKRGDDQTGGGVRPVLSHVEVSGEITRVPSFAQGGRILAPF